MTTARQEIDLLRVKRAELAARIDRLRPGAFGRLVLAARLAEVTRRLLKLELTAPLGSVPEAPEEEGHTLRYWQK